MLTLTPTAEQSATITRAEALMPHETMVIKAFAGTAKTTTLEMITQAMPEYSFLYLAFNKAITEEAKKRFPANVTIKTTHSLAFGYTAVGKKLRQNNFRAAEVAEMFGVQFQVAEAILSTFEFFCNSALDDFSEIEADDEIIDRAREMYDDMRTGNLDVTHSWYLKEFQLSLSAGNSIRQNFDYCLLDEYQDTNPVTLSLFYNLPGRKYASGTGTKPSMGSGVPSTPWSAARRARRRISSL